MTQTPRATLEDGRGGPGPGPVPQRDTCKRLRGRSRETRGAGSGRRAVGSGRWVVGRGVGSEFAHTKYIHSHSAWPHCTSRPPVMDAAHIRRGWQNGHTQIPEKTLQKNRATCWEGVRDVSKSGRAWQSRAFGSRERRSEVDARQTSLSGNTPRTRAGCRQSLVIPEPPSL